MDESLQLEVFIDEQLAQSNTSHNADEMDDLLIAICERVQHLLEYEPELLFSSLYRLDVSEVKVKSVLEAVLPTDKIKALAQLILDRQIARHKTKTQHPQTPIEGWQW